MELNILVIIYVFIGNIIAMNTIKKQIAHNPNKYRPLKQFLVYMLICYFWVYKIPIAVYNYPKK